MCCISQCLISRGKITFKPHKWWCFWEKRQQKGKPTSPQCKDFTMNSPIVFILHPQSWCLLSLKSFQFPKIIWNTPTSGAFDKQSSFYRQKQLCICVCVCARAHTQTRNVFERQKDEFRGEGESDGTLLSYTAWAPVTWVGFTVTHKRVYERGSSLHGSLSWDCKKLWGNFTLMLRIKIMMNVLSTYNVPGNFLRALIHVKSRITHKSLRLILFLSHSTDEKKKKESQRSRLPNR